MNLCKLCNSEITLRLDVTGGCMGHYGDDRCYCDGPNARVIYWCSNIKCKNRHRKDHNKLTDQYSIGEWLTENYKLEI